MAPSRTRVMGMEVHQASLAVAYVAQEHGAAGMDLGAIGTRPWDLAPRIRQRPSTATPPIFVSDAGPGGSWLSRSLPPQGDDGWGVAPSVRPQKAGDRVTTDRRAAVPLARWARAGALTAVSVPTVDADAIRDRTRARTMPSALSQTPRVVSTPLGSDRIAVLGAGPLGTRPPSEGARRWAVPHRPSHASFQPMSVRCLRRPHAARVSTRPGTITCTPGACTRGSRRCTPGAGCHAPWP